MVLKKSWYEILSPSDFGEKVVGETLAADPKQLIGRVVKTSLGDITGNYSKFYIKLHFRIVQVDGNKCKTSLIGHNVQTDRVYRMVRRHTRKIDVVHDVDTKDGCKVRVKIILVLSRRVKMSLKTTVREKVIGPLEEKARLMGFVDFVKLLISGGFLMELKKACSAVYPVAQIEIHKSELLSGEVVAKTEKHVESEEKKNVEEVKAKTLADKRKEEPKKAKKKTVKKETDKNETKEEASSEESIKD
ncbi:MAG: 30S ribosomal protein S3ae [Candidatus Aenigmatarchaeota archaeon]